MVEGSRIFSLLNGCESMKISKETFDKWRDSPILHDEDEWNGKYETYGEMFAGEGYEVEE